jgi:regulator of protease activity HflC (stomatin/prohibitin superfamily)
MTASGGTLSRPVDIPTWRKIMQSEKTVATASGGPMLVAVILAIAASIALFIVSLASGTMWLLIGSITLFVVCLLCLPGFFIVNPNEAVAVLLFGDYKGTTRRTGFHWANPFYSTIKISLRARNLNGERLKVNDSSGNPVEIAVVVVWKVSNTAHALFEVDDYEEYVHTQSESAVRHLASAYAYDGEDGEVTLRGATEEINERLSRELDERLNRAGVDIIEARISHLAYAAEIAHAMLQRQQASAVVAARKKIVEGAVGMVEMALSELGQKQIVDFDDDKKATLVSNLLVVLCSEHAAQPVVNTGDGHP